MFKWISPNRWSQKKMWGPRDDQGADLFNMAWKTDRSQLGVELAPGKSHKEPKNNKKWKSREQEQKLVIGRSRPLLKQSKNRVHEKSICVSQSGVDDGRTRHEIHYDCPFLPNSYPDVSRFELGTMGKDGRDAVMVWKRDSRLVEKIGGLIINQFWFITRIQSCTTRGFPK